MRTNIYCPCATNYLLTILKLIWFVCLRWLRHFIQWAGLACVAVLEKSSVVQIFLFCGIQVAIFIALALLRPFANR